MCHRKHCPTRYAIAKLPALTPDLRPLRFLSSGHTPLLLLKLRLRPPVLTSYSHSSGVPWSSSPHRPVEGVPSTGQLVRTRVSKTVLPSSLPGGQASRRGSELNHQGVVVWVSQQAWLLSPGRLAAARAGCGLKPGSRRSDSKGNGLHCHKNEESWDVQTVSEEMVASPVPGGSQLQTCSRAMA